MEGTEEINDKQKLNSKNELIINIKEQIKIDTDIAKLKTEIKEKVNKKKGISASLVKIMKNNSIDCFNINGGSLVYKQKKTKKTISAKFLLQQLEKYYKDQPEVAKDITQQVLDNRNEVIKDEIKLKIDK